MWGRKKGKKKLFNQVPLSVDLDLRWPWWKITLIIWSGNDCHVTSFKKWQFGSRFDQQMEISSNKFLHNFDLDLGRVKGQVGLLLWPNNH